MTGGELYLPVKSLRMCISIDTYPEILFLYNICYRKPKSIGLFAGSAYVKLVAYSIREKEVIKIWIKTEVFCAILKGTKAGTL